MSRVLIVCSVHHETGNATAAELHWLLGRLRPDVLFLEHSDTDITAFLDGSCDSLELAAVTRYRGRHAIELVPLGLPLPDTAAFKLAADAMFARIEQASPRYCELDMANLHHTGIGGLAFLNSAAGVLLQSEIQREIRTTVDAFGDPTLSDTYARWTSMNHLRELAMINGVEDYATRTSFRKGILIVGAAHRTPLFEKLRQRDRDADSPVSWEFEWDPNDNVSGDSRPDGMATD